MKLIISLLLGCLIGYLFNLSKKTLKINSSLQLVIIFILLFSMGLSIGINPKILNNLDTIGLSSLIFALLTTVFSIVFVFFIGKIILKE